MSSVGRPVVFVRGRAVTSVTTTSCRIIATVAPPGAGWAAKTPRAPRGQALREATQWGVAWRRLPNPQTGINHAFLQPSRTVSPSPLPVANDTRHMAPRLADFPSLPESRKPSISLQQLSECWSGLIEPRFISIISRLIRWGCSCHESWVRFGDSWMSDIIPAYPLSDLSSQAFTMLCFTFSNLS